MPDFRIIHKNCIHHDYFCEMMIKKWFLFCLILISLTACKKDADTADPLIAFLEPSVPVEISLPDTLDVKIRVTDDRIIQSVTVNLVNDDKTPIVKGRSFVPLHAAYLAEASFVLVDKAIESGSYSIQVIAFDGTNTKTEYLEVYLQEIPRELLGFIAVTAPLSFRSKIIRLNAEFATDTEFVMPETFHLSAIHCLWERFLFVSAEPSVMTAFNPFTFEPEWEAAASPPRPVFTSVMTDQDIIFSTDNGDAGIMDIDGNVILRTAPYYNMTINCLAADDRYIYVSQHTTGGTNNELTVFYRETGAIRSRELVASEIAALAAVNDRVLLFMPAIEGIEIYSYNTENFILNKLNELPGENLVSVEKISENEIIICTDSRVVTYEVDADRFNTFTDRPFKFSRYDKLLNRVFLASDSAVFNYDFATGILTGNIPFPDKVVDFQILYNK
jgi:hypothetical protein